MNIYSIFQNNSYLNNVVKHKVVQWNIGFKAPMDFGHCLCPVYLKLPWIGRSSQTLDKLNVVFDTIPVFPPFTKDGLPCLQGSSVIYQFKCGPCKVDYVGQTKLQLETYIEQHIPTHIRHSGISDSTRLTQLVHESAIGLHLVNKPGYTLKYFDEAFRVLHKAQSVKHLHILEAVHIKLHWPEASLCRQKENILHSPCLMGWPRVKFLFYTH